jgi:hypothetical protein
MKKLILLGALALLMARPEPVRAGPISDTCASAYHAEAVIKMRIVELDNRKGDFYEEKIDEYMKLVLRALLQRPQEIIRDTCSV